MKFNELELHVWLLLSLLILEDSSNGQKYKFPNFFELLVVSAAFVKLLL